jgi:hypothetical protein
MGRGHLKIFFSRTTGPILTRLVQFTMLWEGTRTFFNLHCLEREQEHFSIYIALRGNKNIFQFTLLWEGTRTFFNLHCFEREQEHFSIYIALRGNKNIFQFTMLWEGTRTFFKKCDLWGSFNNFLETLKNDCLR